MEQNIWQVLFGLLLLSSVPALITIPMTMLLCRWRIAHQKRISYGTVLFAACLTTLLTIFVADFYDSGWEIFTVHYWTGPKQVPIKLWLKLWAFGSCISILPALWVVNHYQRCIRTST